jgi:hypothetical protein
MKRWVISIALGMMLLYGVIASCEGRRVGVDFEEAMGSHGDSHWVDVEVLEWVQLDSEVQGGGVCVNSGYMFAVDVERIGFFEVYSRAQFLRAFRFLHGYNIYREWYGFGPIHQWIMA